LHIIESNTYNIFPIFPPFNECAIMPDLDTPQSNTYLNGFARQTFINMIPFSLKFNFTILFYYSLNFFNIVPIVLSIHFGI
jgi:hypothetical protein